MFPDRRVHHGDPRSVPYRDVHSQPLRNTRSYLTEAATLFTQAPNGDAPASTVRQESSTNSTSSQFRYNPHRERFNVFRPRSGRRSRSLSTGNRISRGSRRRKLWEHTFCCLASRTQRSPPGAIERGHLMQAGLGEKVLTFDEMADAEDIHMELLSSFPKLGKGGGYELLRTSEKNTHKLDVIPQPPSGYTVSYLKSVTGQAKVYVRPLQKDLDLTPTEGEETELCPRETCQKCGSYIPLSQLRDHIDNCGNQHEAEQPTTPPSSPTSPAYSPLSPNYDGPRRVLTPNPTCSRRCFPPFSDDDDFQQQPIQRADLEQSIQTESDTDAERNKSDVKETESLMLDHALRESANKSPDVIDLCHDDFSPTSLDDIIAHLQSKLFGETHAYHIRRSSVLQDLLRETRKNSYSPLKRVVTYFVGEQGKDTGGLTRELWTLFSRSIKQSLCEGKENMLVLRHDATKLQEGMYRKVGMLMGISFIQGGSSYAYFAPSLFSYITGMDICSIKVTLDEVPDCEATEIMTKLMDSTNSSELQEVAQNGSDLLISCGFTKPLATLNMSDKQSIIESVTLHSTILKIKAELDELVKGMDDAGILNLLRKYPEMFRPLFINNKDKCLTAAKLMSLFDKKVFSEEGSSEFVREQGTYILFTDLLEELESVGGIAQDDMQITLSDCLQFFTGASEIPPGGFNLECTLNFNSTNIFPTASTCSLTLTLPTKFCDNYEQFKEKMVYGLINHGGFGLY